MIRNGIPSTILIAPLMPGINDDPRQVEPILEAAAAAGATSVSGIGLHLRGAVREVFMEWLRSYRPDLVERYEELYAHGAYLRQPDRRRIERAAGAPWAGVSYEQRFRHRGRAAPARMDRGGGPATARARAPRPDPPLATSKQGRLF
jgi:DNA repair photolyase